jgi:hypothetical protein
MLYTCSNGREYGGTTMRSAIHQIQRFLILAFVVPTFKLDKAPCGCMYSSVIDLGLSLNVLFNGKERAQAQGNRSGDGQRCFQTPYTRKFKMCNKYHKKNG